MGGSTTITTDYQYASNTPRLTQVSDNYASASYGYDAFGRLNTQTNVIHGALALQTVKMWGYDQYSRLDSLTISNATTLLWGAAYGYDVDRIIALTDMHSGSYWQYGYDYQGQLTGANLFSDSNTIQHVEHYQYDAVGNMTHKGIAGNNADVRMLNNADDEAVEYQRHKTTTLIGTVDNTNAALSLPVNQTGVVQDEHGNWVAPLVPLFPMSNGNVRIQLKAEVSGQPDTYKLADFSVFPTSTNLDYDANGALLTLPDGTNTPSTLSWNAEERLASTTSNTSTNNFYYDDTGRRIAKVEDGSLTLYLWDGWNNAATANGSAQLTAYYSRGTDLSGDLQGAGGIGGLVAVTRMGSTNDHADGINSGTFLLHSNHRGDIVQVTDSTGAVVAENRYMPFGNLLSENGTFSSRYRFSSKEMDASGLYYYGYRYYSPHLCRWISMDPIGEHGGINLYRFCGNDPVNFIDPLGYKNEWFFQKFPWNKLPITRGFDDFKDAMERRAEAVKKYAEGSPSARDDYCKTSEDIPDALKRIVTDAATKVPGTSTKFPIGVKPTPVPRMK